MRESVKHYTEDKKKHIKDIQKNWYQKNKEIIKKKNDVKIKCDICNCEIVKRCLTKHKKSKKHLKNENNNI